MGRQSFIVRYARCFRDRRTERPPIPQEGRPMRTGLLLAGALTMLLALPTMQARATDCSGLDAKITAAKTAADHETIAACYDDMAKTAQANADAHRHMDSHYNEAPYKSAKLGAQRHCRALVASYTATAKDAEALAKVHRDMAKT